VAKPLYIPDESQRIAGLARGQRRIERRGPGRWHLVGSSGEPAFENSWANVGGTTVPCRFRFGLNGLEIQGAVTGGSNSDPVFTLPNAAYADSAGDFILPGAADGSGNAGSWKVATNGDVYFVAGGGVVVGEWITVGTAGLDGVDSLLAANPHPYATGDTPGPPPFENGWTNRGDTHDYPVQFKLTPDNWIRLRGVAVNGAANTTIFTLPAGYRPDSYAPLDQRSTNAGHYVELTIQSDGQVVFEQEV
jgi:hypothetical protein